MWSDQTSLTLQVVECTCVVHLINTTAWMLDPRSPTAMRSDGSVMQYKVVLKVTFILWWNINLMGVVCSRVTMPPSIKHERSLNYLKGMKMMWIIRSDFCTHQISTQSNIYRRFWTDMLDSALQINHQNTEWRLFFRGLVFHPFSGVQQTCRMNTKVHWSCSGCM